MSDFSFESEYRQAVRSVSRFLTPEMQQLIAEHNQGWSVEEHDFRHYLDLSLVRFQKAYERIRLRHPDGGDVVDFGGFWGVLPICLAQAGYRVTMTETLRFYGKAFDPLFDHIRTSGVTVIDFDPFVDEPLDKTCDVITAMAILEHYPHSLQQLMTSVVRMLRPQGSFIGDVPNLAYLEWRLRLLRGRSPLAPIGTIYRSAIPFTGHHHEFVTSELEELADLAGLQLAHLDYFNYSSPPGVAAARAIERPRRWLAGSARRVLYRRYPRLREIIGFEMRRP